ncbi:MAG: M48 family metalloprotease [Chloracidobacterium sp.]|nr:M48 family metalloprotease [Chloracidobacterium sp.]MDW8218407.1 M48 family metalloprotease [Acidobacteriota bacterium]
MTNQTALSAAGRAYQDFRLWSGIGSIGWNLLFFTVFVLAGLHVALFQALGVEGRSSLWTAAFGYGVFYAVHAALNFPFELLTGWAAERSFGMTRRTLRQWLTAYLIGVGGQGIMFVLGLTALWRLREWLPTDWEWAAAGVVAVGSLALAFLQPFLLPPVVRLRPFDASEAQPILTALPAALRAALPKTAVFTGDDDEAVNGGLVGWGPTTRLWLSRTTLEKLRPEQTACLLAREIGHLRTGHRTLGIVVSSLWLAVGLGFAAALTDQTATGSPADLLVTAVAMTWWSFAGLFVLPALGRRSVLAADRFYLDNGGDPQVLRETLMTLATINRAQPDIVGVKQQVFHPLPSLDARLAHIETYLAGGR